MSIFLYIDKIIKIIMATIKIENPNPRSSISGITSSNVSSSLSGNMRLIKSQTINKNVDYINVKNAVKILENYSNWNGYIKLYTEVQSNFEVGDTVYITYLSDTIDSLTFDLSNPLEPDEGGNRFYLGYKILYVNTFKSEMVINRHFNDIGLGYNLSNQYLSKVSCRGGDLFDDISDGVVFYNCNILNGGFGRLHGVVSGLIAPISNATILCSGLSDISDLNGNYSLSVPSGNIIVKCSAPGYITNTFTVTMTESNILTKNILMTPGSNSISIVSGIDTTGTTICCYYDYIQFSASTIGYDFPVKYQWILKRSSNINIGSDNPKLVYTGFQSGDIIYCTVTDSITSGKSNSISISLLTPTIYVTKTKTGITNDTFNINYGDSVTLYANAQCYSNPTYEWRINNVIQSYLQSYTSTTFENSDSIYCIIAGIPSTTITANVTYTTAQLGYSPFDKSYACGTTKNTYYIAGNDFSTAIKLFKDSIGTLADSGFYSGDGHYRYWTSDTGTLTTTSIC